MQGTYDPNMCVIDSSFIRSDGKTKREACPLCSNALIEQHDLIANLQTIEQNYLTKVELSAVSRMQYDYYCRNYRDPLRANGREFVEVSLEQIDEHFSQHRISQERLMLSDIAHARRVERTLVSCNEGSDRSDQTIKTWMQLSKHKHELVRTLVSMGDKHTETEKPHQALNSV